MRTVLQFERLTPEPGPDADAVRHEWVGHVTADEAGVLEVGGIATVWELLAGHVRWLFAENGQSDGEKAATHLDDVVGGSKMLLFRLARQRTFDVAGVVAPMAEAYRAAVTELDSLVG